MTALHFAVMNRNLKMILFLVRGPEAACRPRTTRTRRRPDSVVVPCAVLSGGCQIERGADPTFSNNVYQSPLDLAESMSDNRVIVQALKRAPKVSALTIAPSYPQNCVLLGRF